MPANVAATIWRRDRTIVVGGLAILGALAWVYLVHLHVPMTGHRIGVARMEGAMAMPGANGWQGADVLVAFLMWL